MYANKKRREERRKQKEIAPKSRKNRFDIVHFGSDEHFGDVETLLRQRGISNIRGVTLSHFGYEGADELLERLDGGSSDIYVVDCQEGANLATYTWSDVSELFSIYKQAPFYLTGPNAQELALDNRNVTAGTIDELAENIRSRISFK